MTDTLKTRLSNQLSSGKWLLTVSCAICFVLLVIAYVRKGADHSISPEAITAIINSVFTSYFNKKGENGKE